MEQLQSGWYDNTGHINPLLTQEEQPYVRQQRILERESMEWQCKKDAVDKAAEAVSLIQKSPGNDGIKAFLDGHYVDNILVSAEFGSIDFSPAVKKDM